MSQDRVSRVGSYVEPEITDARIARQWAGVERRLPTGAMSHSRWVRPLWVGVPMAVAAAVLALWLGGTRAVPGGDSLVESAESPIAMQLHDGSKVELDAHSRLRVVREQADAVEVALAKGAARFDVSHVEGRRFSVSAGAALVNVVGTRFEVARVQRPEGTLVRVEVMRGVVEVRRRDQPDSVRRLSAGETWSALLPNSAPVAAQSSLPPSAATPIVGPEAVSASPRPTPTLEGDSAGRAERDNDDSGEQHKSTAGMHARALFLRANVARRAGQMKEAADAYEELLRRNPRDARSGLAAFELGRIRMDALGDARGAVQAFERALELSRRGGFREDAHARIVAAYDSLGQTAACLSARERYLKRYPTGVHGAWLAVRCR